GGEPRCLVTYIVMPETHFRELTVTGAYEFTPQVFADERGVFVSPFQRSTFTQALGYAPFSIARTGHSVSRRGTVRGVHYTATPPGVAKYVYCAQGKSISIILDIRMGS